MKDLLPFFINNSGKFSEYIVKTEDIKKKSTPFEKPHTETVTTLEGIVKGKSFPIFSIHADSMPHWDKEQTEILKQITEPLNDFASYKWEEIKKPLIDYWVKKQKKAVMEQKVKGIQTVLTPAGNYALWSFCRLITHVLIAKYIKLRNVLILEDLDKGISGFEKDFNALVIVPVKTYISVEQICKTESDQKLIAEKIVDSIVGASHNRLGASQDLMDPDFKMDEIAFLSRDEERELNSLFFLYDELEESAKADQKLSDIEKKIRMHEFWATPQGRRLSLLNSRRVYGGSLKFEKKEELKRKRVSEIVTDLEQILRSWNIEDKYVKHGLQHYQDLYEKEAYKRFLTEKTFEQKLTKAKTKFDDEYTVIKGIWDDSSLNFIGILVGIAAGFGLSIASLANSYQIYWGIGSAILSFALFTLLFKWKLTKKLFLKLSRWVLKDKKEE